MKKSYEISINPVEKKRVFFALNNVIQQGESQMYVIVFYYLHLIVVGFIKAISLKLGQCPQNKLHTPFPMLQIDFPTATFDSIPREFVYERTLRASEWKN